MPTYNEEENVVPLSEAIISEMNSFPYDYELVFVDNDSRIKQKFDYGLCEKNKE